MLIQQLCKSFPATLLPKENEFVEHDQHLHLTIPTLAKPVADRNDGAALWRKVPRKTAENAKAVFAFVRDPLDRFASGWREMRAYERGPAGRRGWGKVVLRQQPFYANATDVPGVANVFGASDDPRPPTDDDGLRDRVLTAAVRNLACSRDWNEHLTPQTDFFPT